MDKAICVLYADDDADDIELFQEILRDIDRSIVVLFASDGLQALRMLREANVLPDIVFLDINMPLINGKECLSEIRRDHTLKALPVVMYSTANAEQEVKDCFELGASDYLCKATHYAKLREDIESILRNLRSTHTYKLL
ncbi:response regulator [Chryseolinea lacunae]|uniref:Response regulator n=1 Tax=Chryseolinea lacunae TaxID=2801331 RepID=A0ABS1KQ32_9BACT|nr:response regulator [Chryseolinea lacunae]MBL0740391.1 response regulator [Chryseolinea lacunae]